MQYHIIPLTVSLGLLFFFFLIPAASAFSDNFNDGSNSDWANTGSWQAAVNVLDGTYAIQPTTYGAVSYKTGAVSSSTTHWEWYWNLTSCGGSSSYYTRFQFSTDGTNINEMLWRQDCTITANGFTYTSQSVSANKWYKMSIDKSGGDYVVKLINATTLAVINQQTSPITVSVTSPDRFRITYELSGNPPLLIDNIMTNIGSPDPIYQITGWIYNSTMDGIPYATVCIDGTNCVTADEYGFYVISGLAADGYVVSTSKEGYYRQSKLVTISNSDVSQNFVLYQNDVWFSLNGTRITNGTVNTTYNINAAIEILGCTIGATSSTSVCDYYIQIRTAEEDLVYTSPYITSHNFSANISFSNEARYNAFLIKQNPGPGQIVAASSFIVGNISDVPPPDNVIYEPGSGSGSISNSCTGVGSCSNTSNSNTTYSNDTYNNGTTIYNNGTINYNNGTSGNISDITGNGTIPVNVSNISGLINLTGTYNLSNGTAAVQNMSGYISGYNYSAPKYTLSIIMPIALDTIPEEIWGIIILITALGVGLALIGRN